MKQKCFTNPLRGGVGMFRKGLQTMTLFALLFGFFSAFGAEKFPFPNNYDYPHGITVTTQNSTITNLYYNWVDKYYVEDGGDLARIKFVQENEDGSATVSEGIAYGMLITVYMAGAEAPAGKTQLNEYEMFKKLWAYYQFNSNDRRIMNWKVDEFTGNPVDNDVLNANGATDAELDAAQALLMAYKQWGDQQFLDDALVLIEMIWNHEMDYTLVLKPGDAFDDYKNPCYFVTNAMALFAKVDPNPTHRWDEAVDKAYDFIQFTADGNTGLIPDWVYTKYDWESLASPATMYIPTTESDKFESYYLYDAIRTQWRMAHAYAWYGHDKAKAICDLVTDWSDKESNGDPGKMLDGYTLDGKPAYTSGDAFVEGKGKWTNSCFTGGFASGGAVDETWRGYMEKGYEKTLQQEADGAYFVETTQLLYLLFMSGNMPNFYDMLPEFVSASTNDDGSEVQVSFSKALDVSSVASSLAGWTIKSDFGNITNAIESVSAENDTSLIFTFAADDMIQDEYQTITYDGTAGLLSIEGSAVAQFGSDQTVIDNTGDANYQPIYDARLNKRPIITTAVTDVDGNYIFLVFDQEMMALSVRSSDFSVTSAGTAKTISTAVVDPTDLTKVTLSIADGGTFDEKLQEDETILLSYDGRLSSLNRQRLKAFTDRSVVNNVTVQKCTEIDDMDDANGSASGAWIKPWDEDFIETWDDLFDNPLSGDAVNSSAKCIQYIKTVGSNGYSAPKFEFTDYINSTLADGQFQFKFQIYSPNAAGSVITFHFRDKTDADDVMFAPGNNLEVQYTIPATATSGWVDATIDFENEKDFQKQLNSFEMAVDKSATETGAGQEIYLDGFQFCSPVPVTEIKSAVVSTSGQNVILKFGNMMTTPTNPAEFKVGLVTGTGIVDLGTTTEVVVDPNDPTKLIVTPAFGLGSSDQVVVSYEGTSARSIDGRPLTHFVEFAAMNAVGRVITAGWRDDFESLTDYITASLGDDSGEYTIEEDNGEDGTITITGTKGSEGYKSFGVTLKDELWDLTENQKVTIRVKSTENFHMRVDLKDLIHTNGGLSDGRTTDGVPVQEYTGAGQWQEMVFDFTGLWKNTYDGDGNTGPVDKTGIYQALFYMWSELPTAASSWQPVTLEGDVVFDYIAIGSAINLGVSSNEIAEGESITATCTEGNTVVYVVPGNTDRDITVLNQAIADGEGYTVEIPDANTPVDLATGDLPGGYYFLYAFDPVSGAISIRQGLEIIDETAPELTVEFPNATMDFQLGSFAQITSTEDGWVIMVPGTVDIDLKTGAQLRQGGYKKVRVEAGQKIGFELDDLGDITGFSFVAVDGADLKSIPSASFTVKDDSAPQLVDVTTNVPKPIDVGNDGYYDDPEDTYHEIGFTSTKDATVYLVTEGTPADEAYFTYTYEGYITETSVTSGTPTYVTSAEIGNTIVGYNFGLDEDIPGKYWLYALDANGNISDPYVVIVGDVECTALTGISIVPTTLIELDETTSTGDIVLSIEPTDADVATTVWSSTDNTIISVNGSSTGATITGVASGTETISVTVTDACPIPSEFTASVDAKYTVEVKPQSILLASSSATIKSFESVVIDATVGPAGVAPDYELSTTSTDVTIVGNTVTAKEVSTETVVEITVNPVDYPLITKTFTLTIEPIAADEIIVVLTPSIDQTIAIDDVLTISASVEGTTTGQSTAVTWTSSLPTVASVSNGIVTGLLAGTTVITATSVEDDTKSKSITVEVEKRAPKTLSLAPLSLTFKTTDSQSETITPAFDLDNSNIVDMGLTWVSSDPTVATVVNGVVNPQGKAGTTTITATSTADSTLSATVTVTISDIEVDLVAIEAVTSLDLGVDETGILTYTLDPVNTTQTGISFSSSAPSILSINATTGAYEALEAGDATITIASTDNPAITATVPVTVTQEVIQSIAITNPATGTLNLVSGGSATITATYEPAYLTNDLTFTVTSGTTVVSVDASGAVSAIGVGDATITVSSAANPSVTKVISVSVTEEEIDVTGIVAEAGAPTEAKPGDVLDFTGFATVQPDEATNQNITWSVSPSSAGIFSGSQLLVSGTVSSDFTVTARSADGGFTVNFPITVNLGVTKVEAIASATLVNQGGSFVLSAEVTGDADNQVTWATTSGLTIGTDGTVMVPADFEAPATVVFTATSVLNPDKSDFVQVSIQEVSTEVTLTGVAIVGATSVESGNQIVLELAYTTDPAGESYVPTTIAWAGANTYVSLSSTSSATVIATGSGDGTATLSVTVDGVTSTTHTITSKADFIGIDVISVTAYNGDPIAPGSVIDLSSYVETYPVVTDEELSWSVSDNATIDQNGVVTANANARGNIVVTIEGSAGTASAKTITIPVEVTTEELADIIVTVAGEEVTEIVITERTLYDVSYTASNIANVGAGDREVTFAIGDESIATVHVDASASTPTVYLKPVEGGTTTLTVTAVNGGATITINVTVPLDVEDLKDLIAQAEDYFTIENFREGKISAGEYQAGNAAKEAAQAVVDKVEAGDATVTGADITEQEVILSDLLPGPGDAVAEASVEVYVAPVPVQDELTVYGADVTSVAVININGTVVAEATGATVSVASLPAGVYTVIAQTTEGAISVKITK
jgi:uncharacterized protein YjdB